MQNLFKRFPIIVVYGLCLLNLLPPLFLKYNEELFDNVYNTILYALCTFVLFAIPFVWMEKVPKIVRGLSNLFGAWFLAGLIFEIANFWAPGIVLNSPENNAYYVKFVIGITIGIAFIITSERWIKQNN